VAAFFKSYQVGVLGELSAHWKAARELFGRWLTSGLHALRT
jgi:hypothetical protein